MSKYVLLLLIAVSSCYTSYSQDKLVIDDRTNLLTAEVEELLKAKLSESDIGYTTMVDFKVRCEYYFSELTFVGDDLFISVKDCNNNTLGNKNLGTRIHSSTAQEKSFLLSYNILEIIADPEKYIEQVAGPETDESNKKDEASGDMGHPINEHNTRYFFAPSAYNLKEGELYYNTIYFLLHDIQYGLSDNFSIGIGTSVAGIPLYLTPKVSIPVGDKSAFAIGDLLILGTYGTNAVGNLLYGSFSTGGDQGNTTFGVGYLATNESDITGKTSSVVFNLNGMARASSNIYLLTENYFFGINTQQNAYYDSYNQSTDTWIYLNEEFNQRYRLWYGVAGIRIISKNKDFVSWQIGLTYVFNFPGKVPDQYSNWEISGSDEFRVIAFPALSYTRKFGKKY